MILVLSAVSLLLAVVPAYFYFRNVGVFQTLPPGESAGAQAFSVLIPARNESANIAACVASVLRSASPDCEVVVLDDHSEDGTAEIVRRMAGEDARVRLVEGAPLPAGWNGKQHACWQLSQAAANERLLFLDADVRLADDALPRLDRAVRASGAALLSGFPRQTTGSLAERLLIPLIHFVLLGFLSLRHLRRTQKPEFAAGCGQLFVTTRDAYRRSGSHAAIRASRHDGIKLPRLYLEHGLPVDVCDATDLASVRMYHGAGETWRGLSKNADEGVASPGLILPVTTMLLLGQVAPLLLLIAAIGSGERVAAGLAAVGLALSLAVRLDAAGRFRQPLVGAVLHPIGVLLFLAIQWSAFFGALTGRQVAWKGRPATTSP